MAAAVFSISNSASSGSSISCIGSSSNSSRSASIIALYRTYLIYCCKNYATPIPSSLSPKNVGAVLEGLNYMFRISCFMLLCHPPGGAASRASARLLRPSPQGRACRPLPPRARLMMAQVAAMFRRFLVHPRRSVVHWVWGK